MRSNFGNGYAMITPIRDESLYVERTLRSVVAQTVLPIEWLFVDDNSTDDTPRILEQYARNYPFIRVVHFPQGTRREPGTGAIRAFKFGVLNLHSTEYDYLAKLDADVSFGSDYFENMMKAFEGNNALGIASGLVCEYRKGKLVPAVKSYWQHPFAAAKLYRRDCFASICPLEEIKSWELVATVKANMAGYDTRIVESEIVLHHKPMDSAVGKRRESYLKGYSSAFLRYHPLFALGKGCKIMLEPPRVIAGLHFFWGYLSNIVYKRQFYENNDVVKFLRKQQWGRILGRMYAKSEK